MSYKRRLEKAFMKAPVLPLSPDSRYVLFSDCHRGQGNSNDNFLKNQHLYFAALQHYYRQGYTYVELADDGKRGQKPIRSPESNGNCDCALLLLRGV